MFLIKTFNTLFTNINSYLTVNDFFVRPWDVGWRIMRTGDGLGIDGETQYISTHSTKDILAKLNQGNNSN